MAGEKEAVVEFEYDGVIPSDSYANLANAVAHPIAVAAVDTLGNWSRVHYSLAAISPHHIATLEGHRPQRPVKALMGRCLTTISIVHRFHPMEQHSQPGSGPGSNYGTWRRERLLRG